MRFQDVQQLFPSIDGNQEQQQVLLGSITKLIASLDELKDENRPLLGDLRERDGDFYRQITDTESVPQEGVSLDEVVEKLKQLSEGHPYQSKYYATNMIPQANIAGILGMMTAMLLNSNPIWDVYGPAAAEAEVKVIAMMSRQAGYDPEVSCGYTTWGGQGAVFNALRLAIAKQFPKAKEDGVPNNLYCFASEGAHYSLLISMEACGIGSKRLISVKTNADNSMDTLDLWLKMEDIVQQGGIPLMVVATTGTTDSFGIDDISAIKEASDSVTERHGLLPVHIHADSAAGGFYTFFNDYDFAANPLDFEEPVLNAIMQMTERLQHIHLADTLCYDFHKLGQTPYAASLFLVKNGHDLGLLDLNASDTPYIGYREYGGSYHTSYTLECSRMASAISMYASLMAFGQDGYRQILANYVRVNLAFRQKLLEAVPNIAITNEQNPGPVTAFRLYPGRVEWLKEINGRMAQADIEQVNELNERLFTLFGRDRDQILLGDTKKLRKVDAIDSPDRLPIYAGKFFSISAYTEVRDVDAFVAFIQEKAMLLQQSSNQRKMRQFG